MIEETYIGYTSEEELKALIIEAKKSIGTMDKNSQRRPKEQLFFEFLKDGAELLLKEENMPIKKEIVASIGC